MKKILVCLVSFGVGTQLWSQQAANSNVQTATTESSQTQVNATTGETTQAPASRPPVSLRVVGSNLMTPQGQYLGRIEEVLLNNANQIEFGLVEQNPSDPVVTPVPWSLLSYVWDQSKAGGTPGAVQTFTIPIDKTKFDQAPKVSRKSRTGLGLDWEQRVYAFYGATPGAIGATGSGSTSVAGGASGGGVVAVPGAVAAPGVTGAGPGAVTSGFENPGFVVGVGGGLVTNTVATNSPVVLSNFVTITNVVGTNRFAGRTNRFGGETNVASAGTNASQRVGGDPFGNGNFLPGQGLLGSRGTNGVINNQNTGGTGSGTATSSGAGGRFTPVPPVNSTGGTSGGNTTILPPSNIAPPGTVVPPADANPPGTVVPTPPGGNSGIFTPGTPTLPGNNAVGGTASGATGSGTGTATGGTTGGGTTTGGTTGGGTSGSGTVGGTAAGAGSSGR